MNTIISKNGHEYRMSIIFDKSTQTYLLVFSSMRDNHGEQYTCASYADAVNRFVANCRWYGLHGDPVILTEEQFLGLNPNALWPRSNQQPLAKEVQLCRA